jgi:very-short-patch-repair endonuclease
VGLDQAKKLRSNMTDAEHRLWYRLRAHRFEGYRFRRQVPVGPYVVDFACVGRKLVVEVDGGQHADNLRDKARDDYLRARGFRVLRFWNNDVLTNTQGVLEMIFSALEQSPSPGALRAPPSPTVRAFTPVLTG